MGGADPPGPRRPATTLDGSTSCACPVRWPGDASPRGPSGPGAAARPRRPPRSPSWCATTSRRCCAPSGPDRVAPEPEVGAAADVLAALRVRGACFRPELAPLTGRLPAEVDEGLWDLVARGLVTADAFSAVRALLSARDRWRTRTVRRPSGRLARRRAPVGIRHRRGPVVAAARARGARRAGRRRRRARAGQRGAGRGGGPAAARCAGASSPGSSGDGSRSRCPGARSSGPCAAWRRAGSHSVVASSPGSRVSSTRCPEAFEELRAVRRRGTDGRAGGRGRGRPAQHDGLHHRRSTRADAPQPARGVPRRHRRGPPRGRLTPCSPSGRSTSTPTSARRPMQTASRWSAHSSRWSPPPTSPVAVTPATTGPWRRRSRRPLEHSVRVGAHPSYPDREGFGRRPMAIDRDELRASLNEQLRALGRVCRVGRHDASSPSRRTGRSTKRSPRAARSTRPSATRVRDNYGEDTAVVLPSGCRAMAMVAARRRGGQRGGLLRPGLPARRRPGRPQRGRRRPERPGGGGRAGAQPRPAARWWPSTAACSPCGWTRCASTATPPGAVAIATAVRQALAGAGIDVAAPARA